MSTLCKILRVYLEQCGIKLLFYYALAYLFIMKCPMVMGKWPNVLYEDWESISLLTTKGIISQFLGIISPGIIQFLLYWRHIFRLMQAYHFSTKC